MTTTATPTASPRQIGYYESLYAQATGAAAAGLPTPSEFVTLSVSAASQAIDAAKVAVTESRAARPAAPKTSSFKVHPGVYTVVGESGRRTFRVSVQPSDAKFAAGQVILSYLAGADNDSDYVGFAFIDDRGLHVWKRYTDSKDLIGLAESLVADPSSALVSKNCARCGRTLTTPESISAGFGPECVSKGLR